MYRCNPFTYLIQAILSTGLANAKVTCAPRELVTLKPPMGETCSSFIGPYTEAAGGYFPQIVMVLVQYAESIQPINF